MVILTVKTVLTPCLLISLTLSTAVPAFGGNWPSWRGPDGNGVSSEKNLPLKWSDKENVRWRVELPGPGNSSPIVRGDRVFVSQLVRQENRRTLMCLDRANGKLLWQSGDTFVLRASPKFEVLATNSVSEQTNASLAAADGELFFRTGKALWCFSAGK